MPKLPVHTSPGPIPRPPARVGESEHYDVAILDLVRHDEREPVEVNHTTIGAISPLQCCLRKAEDERQHIVDFVLECGSETVLLGLVVVHLVIDLGQPPSGGA